MNERISDEYRQLNRDLHETRADYGARAHKRADFVATVIKELKFTSVLDYGCGKGALKPALEQLCPGIQVTEYDPAIPGKDGEPEPVDFVVCLDVMEHVEPDKLEGVLAHIRSLARKAAFMLISTRPATKTLADGRNAHLIVEPLEWWQERLAHHFMVAQIRYAAPTILVTLLGPK